MVNTGGIAEFYLHKSTCFKSDYGIKWAGLIQLYRKWCLLEMRRVVLNRLIVYVRLLKKGSHFISP